MVASNSGDSMATKGAGALGATDGTNPGLGFGNLRSQTCGAMFMGLLHSQGEIAKTGAHIAENFTEQQKTSYQGQSEFLQGGLEQSFHAADEQKQQMQLDAYSNFVSAGVSATMGLMPMMHKSSLSTDAAKLDNLNDKLNQQESMLKTARETTPTLQDAQVSDRDRQQITNAKDQYIRDRRMELLRDAGSSPKVLSTEGTGTKYANGEDNNRSEAEEFPQNTNEEFNRKAGKYYRTGPKEEDFKDANGTVDKEALEKAKAQWQSDLSNEVKTNGAYHIDGLDKAAIESMSPSERDKLIKQLNENVATTHKQINTQSVNMQIFQQTLSQIVDVFSNGGKGTCTLIGATHAAKAKKGEARATIANQEAGVAGGVSQAAAQTRGEVMNTINSAFGGFSGAFQSMARG